MGAVFFAPGAGALDVSTPDPPPAPAAPLEPAEPPALAVTPRSAAAASSAGFSSPSGVARSTLSAPGALDGAGRPTPIIVAFLGFTGRIAGGGPSRGSLIRPGAAPPAPG